MGIPLSDSPCWDWYIKNTCQFIQVSCTFFKKRTGCVDLCSKEEWQGFPWQTTNESPWTSRFSGKVNPSKSLVKKTKMLYYYIFWFESWPTTTYTFSPSCLFQFVITYYLPNTEIYQKSKMHLAVESVAFLNTDILPEKQLSEIAK